MTVGTPLISVGDLDVFVDALDHPEDVNVDPDHQELVVGNLGRWQLTRLGPGRSGVRLVHPDIP